MNTTDTTTTRRCLDGPDGCSGPATLHPSLAGTGTMIPRCDAHYEAAVERDAKHREIYPDSPIAPSWFDPTACGEHWDEDY